MPVGGAELRQLAAADRVRALHDHAPGRLAEDVRQARRRHPLGGDQLGERLAGADRRELVGVADQHDVGSAADRAQQRDQQLEVRHRGLVDDQQVALQRILLVVGRALAGDPAERRVHGARAQPTGLGHPHRGASGRGDQHAPSRAAARRRAAIDLIEAVLPVPGPPVITDSRCASALADAARCSPVSSCSPASARPARSAVREPLVTAALRRARARGRRARPPARRSSAR